MNDMSTHFPDVTVSVPAMVSVGEGDGTVTVCARLSAVEATERNFTISLNSSDGTGNVIQFKSNLHFA